MSRYVSKRVPEFGSRCQIRYDAEMRYLGEHHEHGSAPVSKFLIAITVGQAAGWGAAALVRGGFHKDACSTKEAADIFVSNGVFMIVSGLVWLALTKKP